MSQTVREIPVQRAAALTEQDAVLLLDVREDDEWAAGHAPRAVHRPLGSLDVGTVPTDRPIVVICRSGNRSGQAAVQLTAAGVDAVNTAGGMRAWQAAGLPVVRPDGTPGDVV